MTRYAIVRVGRRFLVCPESKIGDRALHCFFLGHIEAAKKLARSMEDELVNPPKFRSNGVKIGAKTPKGQVPLR